MRNPKSDRLATILSSGALRLATTLSISTGVAVALAENCPQFPGMTCYYSVSVPCADSKCKSYTGSTTCSGPEEV